MKTFSAPVLAALASGEVAIVQLVLLGFTPTPVALNTSNWDLDWDGITYRGAYGLGSVSAIKDQAGEMQGLNFTIAAGDPANLALALDDADVVQGTVVTIRTAIIETATYTILDAPKDWVGTLDTMAIGEDGQTAEVSVTAESKGVDLLRGTPGFYADSDQRAINPADGSFSYVVDQIDKVVAWPARSFFYQ